VKIDKGEGTFVLKCIDKSPASSDEKERDIGYSSRLNSEYLVKYHEIFEWNKHIFIVMPYYAEGSLGKFIKKHINKGKKISKIVCFSIYYLFCFAACGKNIFHIIIWSFCSSF
jgi:serine/threonine protein kinase